MKKSLHKLPGQNRDQGVWRYENHYQYLPAYLPVASLEW